MTKRKHSVVLMGGSPDEVRIKAKALSEIIDALVHAATLATRFEVEGVSARQGPRPKWLEDACGFEILALSPGSVAIAVDALPLGQVDPGRFSPPVQLPIDEEMENDNFIWEDATVIDIMGARLKNVLEQKADEVTADGPLLDSFENLVQKAREFGQGVRFEGILGVSEPVIVGVDDLPKIRRLKETTPAPQAVRVAGVLDCIRASSPKITLLLKDGSSVEGRLEHLDKSRLREMWHKEVVISGMAHFGPTQRLLRVDVRTMDLARPEDSIFQQLPTARVSKVKAPIPSVEGKRGVAGFFGTWPGDETDEEFQRALEVLK